MALLTLLDAQLAYGHVALLDKTSFALDANERVGLIGRNGSGKSSLLRILGGLEQPDDGVLHVQQSLRIAYVAQEPSLDAGSTVFDAVRAGVDDVADLRERYLRGGDGADLDQLQSRIEALDGWNWEQRVDETLMRLHLPGQAVVGQLSGGTRKRVALARALVARPDVLLLDEPTNHLDLESIAWLEQLLQGFAGSVVTVTHDRHFLDQVVTRIVELDRGRLYSYSGNFSAFLRDKETRLAEEAVLAAKADKLLAQEEAWIRKGVEARRTRSQSRVQRLQQLRAQRAARREALGRVQIDLSAGQRSGRIVAELTGVGKTFVGDTAARTVVRDFSATFLRGDRVGLVGPNGAGKTTLLKIILGQLAPDSGTVRLGTRLDIAYFDQMREALDPDATLEDFISPGSEWIEIGASRQHVRSYLGDFLFPPARAQSPVRSLSGGERNRLLLARLFARPANLLVLDEPTNDLDIETLELLEERLQSYEGTVFLVSHDRSFVDNVVTSTVVCEGDGRWREYEGGISDWLQQSARARQLLSQGSAGSDPAGPAAPRQPAPRAPAPPPADTPDPLTAPSRKKLSYKDQRELEAIPQLIEQLEAEQREIERALGDPAIYANDGRRAAQLHERQGQIEDQLGQVLERWTALEGRA